MEFKVGECVSFGWETFKKRAWFFIGAVAVVFLGYSLVLGIIDGIVIAIFGQTGKAVAFVNLIQFVLQMFVGMGMISFFLKSHDDVHAAVLSDFWHPQPFWRYAGATILLSLIIAVGLLLLIVPGIIAMLALMFTTYLIVDRSLGPIEAIKESMRITKGHRVALLTLVLAIIGATILGLLLLVVGLLVVAPVCALATAHAYRMLEHSANEIAPVSA